MKRKTIFLSLMAALAVLLAACGAPAEPEGGNVPPEGQVITPEEPSIPSVPPAPPAPPEEENPAGTPPEPPADQDPDGTDAEDGADADTGEDAKEGGDSAGGAEGQDGASDAADPQEDTFLSLLTQAGRAPEDISARQLIIVRSEGNEADIFAFAVGEDGGWSQFLGKTAGHTGKNGVSYAKSEGDRTTPAGLFPLPSAFGVEADPGCLLPYRQATGDSYWVDDPDSVYYNQWVEGTENRDWDSAEHLCDYPEQYAYAAVIGYNIDPVTPGSGSAIFLHCGNRPTAGCVSLPQEEMVTLLTWLDPEKDPAILIF